MDEPYIKKGSKFKCFKCGSVFCEAANDLYRGEPVSAADFKGIDSKIINGQRIDCFKCGTHLGGQINVRACWELGE